MLHKRMGVLFGVVIFLGMIGIFLVTTAVKPTTAGDSDTFTYLPFLLIPEDTPTPTPTNDPEWLQYVNGFRMAAGLVTLTEEADWSNGAWLHGRYMVKNDVITHTEDPSNMWYSPEGAAAADHGNIYVSSSASATFEAAINWWMRAPFHALPLLDPELQRTGFGIYNETGSRLLGSDWQMGATIDVERGRDDLPMGTSYPITYPSDGGTSQFTHFAGFEYPNPLDSCSGYAEPAGAPLIIQLGEGNSTINVTASSLQQDGADIPYCIFDETNYSSSDGNAQNSGRTILDIRDAIIMMPRNPLQVGSVYTAEVTNDGIVYSWQFTVVASKRTEDREMGSAAP